MLSSVTEFHFLEALKTKRTSCTNSVFCALCYHSANKKMKEVFQTHKYMWLFEDLACLFLIFCEQLVCEMSTQNDSAD